MKNKYTLMKILLVLLVFVIAGVIYSCVSSSKKEVEITEAVLDATDSSGSDQTETEVVLVEPKESEPAVCVHVCGAVANAGVYYLKQGDRVHQAVEMAGGLKSDAAEEYVNLADILVDGMQIYIPTKDEVLENGGYTIPAAKTSDSGDLININTAGISELVTLPGIGESRAEAIISYRENVMSFQKTEDIINVSGIGESLYEKIKNYIKV